jgi:hypothetical protein
MITNIMTIGIVGLMIYGCLKVFYVARMLDDSDKFNYEEKRRDLL